MEMSVEQINKLINTLNDEDYEVRKNLEDVLVKLGDQSLEPLISALNHSNSEIRMQAAGILGRIGDKRAVDRLSWL